MPALSSAFVRFGSGAALAPAQLCDAAERSGASALVLDAGLEPARFEPLLAELARRRASLPLLAVEGPCPRTRASAAQLAAVDRGEAEAAVRAVEATLRATAALAPRFAVLRLGAVQPAAGDWTFARERFLRDQLDGSLARRMVAARDDAAEPSLDAARRALERLSRVAESTGVTLLVANPRRYVDLPSAQELALLLADLAGAPLAPLCDVAAAHLPDEMGFWPLALTLDAFAPAPVWYLGDACGPLGALPPGRGLLDVAALAKRRPEGAETAFSPWSGLTVEESLAAVGALARL
jgi:hypothetical protein